MAPISGDICSSLPTASLGPDGDTVLVQPEQLVTAAQEQPSEQSLDTDSEQPLDSSCEQSLDCSGEQSLDPGMEVDPIDMEQLLQLYLASGLFSLNGSELILNANSDVEFSLDDGVLTLNFLDIDPVLLLDPQPPLLPGDVEPGSLLIYDVPSTVAINDNLVINQAWVFAPDTWNLSQVNYWIESSTGQRIDLQPSDSIFSRSPEDERWYGPGTATFPVDSFATLGVGDYRLYAQPLFEGGGSGSVFMQDLTLRAPFDDAYEPNNSADDAYFLDPSTQKIWLGEQQGIAVLSDDDWYAINVDPGTERLLLDLVYTGYPAQEFSGDPGAASSDTPGEIKLDLYDSSGVLISQASATPAGIAIDRLLPGPGDYYFKVYAASQVDPGITYDLRWDLQPGSNPPPVISLSVAPEVVREDDGDNSLVYTFQREGSLAAELVVGYTISGTAELGEDYTLIEPNGQEQPSYEISFAPNQSTATLRVVPVLDSLAEPDESVIITITPSTATPGDQYSLGTTYSASGIIHDDTFPVISLAVSPVYVGESAARNLIYTFTRTGSTAVALSVNFSVDGTATLDNDYTQSGADSFSSSSGSITFAVGSATSTITIAPSPDSESEADETLALRLLASTEYSIASTEAVIATISNDSTAPTLLEVALGEETDDLPSDSPLILRFSEPVQAGEGSIVISSGDGTVVRSLNPQTAVITGSEIRFALEPALQPGRTYLLSSQGQPLSDLSSNPWAGLEGPLTYGFTTAAQEQRDPDGTVRLESELGSLTLKDDQGQQSLEFSGDLIRRTLALVTPETPWTQAARQFLDLYRFNGIDSSSTSVSTDNAAFLDFSVRASSLQAVTVEIDLTTEVRANAYVKINPRTGEAFDFTYDPATDLGAELLDLNSNGLVDRLRIHLRDGARGDVDGVVNGEIRDPGALAQAPRSPVYRFYRDGSHFYTNSEAERDSIIGNSYAPGVNYASLNGSSVVPDPITGGWGYRFEGVAYQSLDTQGTALYRFYNPVNNYHFMTLSSDEALNVIRNSVGSGYDLSNASGQSLLANGWGYQYEGTSYRVSSIPQLGMDAPVYRFYNVARGTHFYSSNADEVKTVITNSIGSQYANDFNAALTAPALLPNGWQYQYEGIAWYVPGPEAPLSGLPDA